MAMMLQKSYGLPVLAIRLGELDGRPCADLRLVDNTEDRHEVVDSRMIALEEFGCDDVRSAADMSLEVPPAVPPWVTGWVQDALEPNSVLWLHFVKPYGVLGAVPWERDLQPAIQIPLLRLPDALPDQDRPSSVFDLALVATAPALEGPSPAAQMGPAVARAIAGGVGDGLRLHVFADIEARDFLRRELAGLASRSVVVHDFDSSRSETTERSGELRNGWLRWIRRAMAGQNLDAVHFIVHGSSLGQDGAILTPLEPDSLDRASPVSVQSGELRSFLTQVGALVVGFSRPPDNYSDFGLRRLVDDLGAVRAGPVVLHDEGLDPQHDRLRECYAFLCSKTPGLPPATPSLNLMAQPKQVYAPDLLLAPPPNDDLPAPADAVQEHFRRDDTPMWLAAAERYLEQQQGELIRYRQSVQERTPTASEQAYYAGVESALRKVRKVVDKHAEESL